MPSGIDRRQFLSDTLAAAALLAVPRAAAAFGDTTTREFVLTAREATPQVGTHAVADLDVRRPRAWS